MMGWHDWHRVAEDPKNESEFLCFDCAMYFPKSEYESPYRSGVTPYYLWTDYAVE